MIAHMHHHIKNKMRHLDNHSFLFLFFAPHLSSLLQGDLYVTRFF